MVKVIECPSCSKEFNHKGKYKKHLLSHEQLKPHKCPECGVFLSAEWVLKRHLETKHSGVKPYTCFQCNVNFTSKDHLHRHLNTRKHTPFICEKCNRQYLRINAFNNHRCSGEESKETGHVQGEARGVEDKIENVCMDVEKESEKIEAEAKFIGLEIEIEGIQVQETKKEAQVWTCPHSLCGKGYSTRFNLRTHIRTAHEKVGFNCQNCKCTIMHKHSFKKHMIICKDNIAVYG